MKRRIAILGSTGSIGTQTLEVVAKYEHLFEVTVLAANNNSNLLIEQSRIFKPDSVIICNSSEYNKVSEALEPLNIKVYTGEDSIVQIVESEQIDIVLVALVGFAGLRPTVSAINAGKAIALANKEVLVVAGEIVTRLAKEKNVPIIPVDSEHSAIFQCLSGELSLPERIYLTASGGPFRGKKRSEIENVRPEEALHHPRWTMGNKVTIDSATMMNKGLEMIEARWLFDVQPDKIDILVHPESIVHSMVEFSDGSIKAQLGAADMRLPIQFALSYPYRLENSFSRIDFGKFLSLNFEPPDNETFPCIELAYESIKRGGNMPCVLNAANEIAVGAFLCGEIGFLEIPQIIKKCMQEADYEPAPDLDSLFRTNKIIRCMAGELCKKSASKP
ncbi:MAG TPA: 1-deoxy-D-xylulose-5-phosphate reductoisomerase [Lentimicrobium sp.]|nr:1-deoxy-D-xylulose-5-phosphate reductoisomerase [Lentimicrobium sp.]